MKKFFEALGALVTFGSKSDPLKDGYAPYGDKQVNLAYNLLFGDKLAAFRTAYMHDTGPVAALLAAEPYVAGLKAFAEDTKYESALRAFAFHRLRELKQEVPEKILLGVVVELGMPEGLDTLAAYADGCLRYINHKGSLTSFDKVPSAWMPRMQKLQAAANYAVSVIGPWTEMRVAPPTAGTIRMSFLVSDGLYFGQGPIKVMEQDPLAKPIIAAAVELVKLAAKPQND